MEISQARAPQETGQTAEHTIVVPTAEPDQHGGEII